MSLKQKNVKLYQLPSNTYHPYHFLICRKEDIDSFVEFYQNNFTKLKAASIGKLCDYEQRDEHKRSSHTNSLNGASFVENKQNYFIFCRGFKIYNVLRFGNQPTILTQPQATLNTYEPMSDFLGGLETVQETELPLPLAPSLEQRLTQRFMEFPNSLAKQLLQKGHDHTASQAPEKIKTGTK